MNSRTDFFRVCDMGDGIRRIEASGIVYCYLVEGTKRAALIDAMVGLGNLRLYTESLTKLPISLLLTHVHFDHIGGAMDFDEAWIPSADTGILADQCNVARKCWFDRNHCDRRRSSMRFSQKDFTPVHPIIWHGIHEGHEFDLGGRTIVAWSLAGHTVGSMGFWDSKTGIFFSGDAGSRSTFLFLDTSTTCAEYLNNLLRFRQEHSNSISMWYNAHLYSEMPATITDDLIQGCRDALDGRIKGPNFRMHDGTVRFVYPINPRWNRRDGGFGNIIVDINHLE